MKSKDQLIEILANAVSVGREFLPDSERYEKEDKISWVWEECTDEEQEQVKTVRAKLNKALEFYGAFENATKTD